MSSFRQVLRVRAYRDLWLGQTISQFGDALYGVAFLFVVKRLTGSAAMVGYTGAMEALPYLFFGLGGGVLADRLDRRKLMLASDLASAGLLIGFAGCAWLGVAIPFWSILALAFALSSCRCFFLPAKSAAIPSLVPAELLMNANAVSAASQAVVPMLGSGAAAAVLAALYALPFRAFFALSLAVNAASFVGSALFILRLPPLAPKREADAPHPLADLREGLRFVAARRDITVLIACVALIRLGVAPFFVAYVVANDQWWGGPAHHGNPQNLALVELFFFAGYLVGSVLIARARPRYPMRWFIGAIVGLGVNVGLMAFSRPIELFALWNFLCGVALTGCDIPISTYLQRSVADAFLGRTSAVLNTIGSVMAPLGFAFGGVFVARFGLSDTFLGMGLAITAAALLGLFDRAFRDAPMPELAPASA